MLHRSDAQIAPDVHIDVSWLVPADLDAVDILVRLRLTAVRRGRSLHLHGARPELADLIDFVGLTEVLHLCGCRGMDADDPDHSPRD